MMYVPAGNTPHLTPHPEIHEGVQDVDVAQQHVHRLHGSFTGDIQVHVHGNGAVEQIYDVGAKVPTRQTLSCGGFASEPCVSGHQLKVRGRGVR